MQADPQTITALGGVIGAIAALMTAIRAHGKATAAHATAQTTGARAETVVTLLTQLLPYVISSSSQLVVTPPPKTTTTPTTSPPPFIPELITWLREEHKATTGNYPYPGGPITEFSKILDQIVRLEQAG